MLINLISNAIKYSPDADEIIVHSKAEEGNVVISIRDFGIGIPSDQTDKIFERFFRTTESASKKIGGLGLGLYIAAQIIKRHQGKIWMDSKPGEGSFFSFSLPLSHD